MNALSLFSGIGGIDLGLQRAGMTIVGQVEIDPWCRRVLAKHWPEVPRHDDVRTFQQWWFRGGPRPYVDLLFGGFPCQPVSFAGKGLGAKDPRWLWPEFAHAVRVFRPRYLLLENVPAVRNRGGASVFGDLAACGYDVQWDCLPASAFGAPHRGDRWFAVAYPAGGTPRDTITRGPGSSVAARQPQPGRRGTGVPDSEGQRRGARGARGPVALPTPRAAGLASQDVADAAGEGLPQRSVRDAGRGSDAQGQRDAVRGSRPDGARVGHWDVEPDVGRVAHGIPSRVDRLRGLGNAVVPQVAEYVGRLIMAWDA